MAPVVGEICDLANATIYAIQGDGLNASLSVLSAIPIGGMWITVSKYAKKAITAIDGSTRTLKWIVGINNKIYFGSRNLLRKVLGLAVGDSRVAHHLIPWEHGGSELVQRAAAGVDNPFNLNELFNGVPINALQHAGLHNSYNAKVAQKLNELWLNNGAGAMSTQTASNLVRGLANQIRQWIISHPYQSINEIVL